MRSSSGRMISTERTWLPGTRKVSCWGFPNNLRAILRRMLTLRVETAASASGWSVNVTLRRCLDIVPSL